MNKSQLIESMATESGLSKADAGKALDAFLNSVTGAMKAGDSVSLVGFGTFSTKERAARTGRNPQTGAEIQIAAATLPNLKFSKGLLDK